MQQLYNFIILPTLLMQLYIHIILKILITYFILYIFKTFSNFTFKWSVNNYSQTWVTNASDHEQFGLRTQSVWDDVLCLELRTRKPSKRRQKQITLDNFLVRRRPSGSEAESSWCQETEKKNPLPNNNISLPHHLPLTPSTLLHTGTVKLN